MAVPTIANLYPARGHAGGSALVRVLGSGFKAPPNPLNGEPVVSGPLVQTVSVTFGGVSSARVLVVNGALLYALVPPSAQGPGAVDVVVTNIDSAGDPIVGETVTLADGFTYEVATLTQASVVSRLTRELLLIMRRQVLPEVSVGTHTDYDADTADGLNTVALSKLPGIVLIGPQLSENRFFSQNGQSVVEDPVGPGFITKTQPYTVDVAFDVVGGADTYNVLANLQHLFVVFMNRNRYLAIDCDPSDPSAGQVRFELDFVENGQPVTPNIPNASNVRQFNARIVVRGVDFNALDGFDLLEGDAAADRTAPAPDEALLEIFGLE